MFNTSTDILVILKSGKINQIWFVIKYALPLLILILAMGLFNYGIIHFFQQMGGDAPAVENGLFRKGTIKGKSKLDKNGLMRKETIN